MERYVSYLYANTESFCLLGRPIHRHAYQILIRSGNTKVWHDKQYKSSNMFHAEKIFSDTCSQIFSSDICRKLNGLHILSETRKGN